MKTQRLYYDDAYTVEFSAEVIETLTVGSHPAVVLDRTYFYPTGGGQPHDTGNINGAPIIDISSRRDDGAVIHVLEYPIDANGVEATCNINWSRRLDYMQQHTGQHILTQAFVQIADAHTIGFHLSPETVTIDVNKPTIDGHTLAEVEALANKIITENRPVIARLIDPDAADGVRMRKNPDQLQLYTDGLRVIDVQDFDHTACGGTHVAFTGEIGILKVINITKRGDNTRIEFACGGRALADYTAKNNVITTLTSLRTCHFMDLPDSITRLQNEHHDQRKTIDRLTDQLLAYEAESLYAKAQSINGTNVIVAAFEERDQNELSKLAAQLTEKVQTIALLATSGDKTHLICARSMDVDQNMNALLQTAFTQLPGGRGGGRPEMAQGGGIASELASVQAALNHAVETLKT